MICIKREKIKVSLFEAVKVAEVLGYANPHDAISQHCDDTINLNSSLVSEFELAGIIGGRKGVILIPESDVYSLILKSRLKSAKEFQKWVCKEVLPSIRKTGSYHVSEVAKRNSTKADLTSMNEEDYKQVIQETATIRQLKVTIEKLTLECNGAIDNKVKEFRSLLAFKTTSITQIARVLGVDNSVIEGYLSTFIFRPYGSREYRILDTDMKDLFEIKCIIDTDNNYQNSFVAIHRAITDAILLLVSKEGTINSTVKSALNKLLSTYDNSRMRSANTLMKMLEV